MFVFRHFVSEAATSHSSIICSLTTGVVLGGIGSNLLMKACRVFTMEVCSTGSTTYCIEKSGTGTDDRRLRGPQEGSGGSFMPDTQCPIAATREVPRGAAGVAGSCNVGAGSP